MKNLIYLVAIACATLTFSSCKKEAKTSEPEATTEQPAEINSIDQAIDEYDKFIDEYIVVLKGSTTGDMEAVKKMQEMAPRLEEISKKFQDATSFTPAQQERLTKIAQKITDAVNPQ